MGANSQAFPSGLMMKGSLPPSQSNPRPLSRPVDMGGLAGEKSIPSPAGDIHLPRTGFPAASLFPLSALGSHQTSFFLSDQGFPARSADARLYMRCRLAGQANPHSGEIHASAFRRA